MALPVAGAGGSATVQIGIPSSATLIGAIFYQQAIVPDQGSVAGFVMSDAATAVIGL